MERLAARPVRPTNYQIEGAVAEGGPGESVWDVFCRKPGVIRGRCGGRPLPSLGEDVATPQAKSAGKLGIGRLVTR
jgi:hypothetical protein